MFVTQKAFSPVSLIKTTRMRTYLILMVLLSMCSHCLSSECNAEFQENKDFQGLDMQHLYSPDAEHCQHLCTQHPICKFFTFVRPDWTRDDRHFYCYLKTSFSGVPNKRTPLLGVTSGFSLKPCNPVQQPCLSKVYQNVDFLGADYKTLFTADYESCQRACTQDPSCQFFTFVNDDFTPQNIRYKCHLKFSWTIPRTPVVKGTAGVVSGFSHKTQMGPDFDTACQGKLFQNTAIPENHLVALPASSAEHCQMLCSAHPSCTYFSFVHESFTCNLKSNVNEMVISAAAGVTSGLPERFCQLDNSWVKVPLENVHLNSDGLRVEQMDDAEACQKNCSEDANCQFYSYITERFHDPDYWRGCYLKRVITMPSPPKVAKLANVVSGFTLKNCQSALQALPAV